MRAAAIRAAAMSPESDARIAGAAVTATSAAPPGDDSGAAAQPAAHATSVRDMDRLQIDPCNAAKICWIGCIDNSTALA
jgi:hypothetical protein